MVDLEVTPAEGQSQRTISSGKVDLDKGTENCKRVLRTACPYGRYLKQLGKMSVEPTRRKTSKKMKPHPCWWLREETDDVP